MILCADDSTRKVRVHEMTTTNIIQNEKGFSEKNADCIHNSQSFCSIVAQHRGQQHTEHFERATSPMNRILLPDNFIVS